MKTAIVFPGQGSQKPGMGQDLYKNFRSARDIFDRVDDALGEKLSKIIFEGNAEELTLTENAQPALMAVGMAVVAVLDNDFLLPVKKFAHYAAGHSLGEYTALTAVSALSLEDSARLLRLRGKAMQNAVPLGEGAMTALLGLEVEDVEKLILDPNIQKQGICVIANDNTFGQTVISGHASAVDLVVEKAKTAGARRTVKLAVSAPFHCALMEPAAQKMAEALSETTFKTPTIPVIANVTAQPIKDSEEIKRNLEDQVCGRVRWRESLIFMKNTPINIIVECGAGKILCGLAKRVSSDFRLIALEHKEGIENFATSLLRNKNV